MTLRAYWETAAISDSLLPDCWVLQGKLVCSTTRTQNCTFHPAHGWAASCRHAAVVVTDTSMPGLSGKGGLPAGSAASTLWLSPPHPTLTKTLKGYHLPHKSFPGASATSRAPGPSQAPGLCTQETAWLGGPWALHSLFWGKDHKSGGCAALGKSWTKLH